MYKHVWLFFLHPQLHSHVVFLRITERNSFKEWVSLLPFNNITVVVVVRCRLAFFLPSFCLFLTEIKITHTLAWSSNSSGSRVLASRKSTNKAVGNYEIIPVFFLLFLLLSAEIVKHQRLCIERGLRSCVCHRWMNIFIRMNDIVVSEREKIQIVYGCMSWY